MFMLTAAAAAAQVQFPSPRPVRSFSQFAGVWNLDPASSTGRLSMAPVTLTIATSADTITVIRRQSSDRVAPPEDVPPEVFRLDGTEGALPSPQFTDERTGRFTLVADMLALTTRQRRLGDKAFTMQTDAYSVDGNVLTLHRQLTSITDAGQILVMQEPTNNTRHTFIYRRLKP